jgi:hypothetical protein
MRRIRILTVLAIACFAVFALASAAPAGDFADGPCFEQSGIDGKVCPTATQGQAYSVKFTLKEYEGCDVFTVSSGSFPPGLTLATDEGVARGTPTQAGNYNFYITVTYSGCPIPKNGSDQRYIINVNPPVQRLIVTTGAVPEASIGQAYSAQLAAGGGSVSSWSLVAGLGVLPDGLTLASNGVISGTPTKSGLFTFTVQANGSPNNGTKQLSIFVLAPLELQTLSGGKPPATGLTAKAAVGANLTTGVKAVGGRAPYAFTSTGALPPGIVLNEQTGAITGAGTTAGRYSSDITVTDDTGSKATVKWSFTVLPLLDFARGKTLPAGKVAKRYSAKIPVTGKDAKTAAFAVSGKIPPGLELDDTGRLTGVLLKAGTYRLKVFAFAGNGAPISKIFQIRVRP